MPISLLRRPFWPVPAVLLALGQLGAATAGTQGDAEAIPVESQVPAAAAKSSPTRASIIADRDRRLAEKGISAGSPLMMRVFKAESELELWLQKDGRFELFATYPICYWSGRLGPKLHEGDKQAPEGFYSVSMQQIHRRGRWPRSINIGFPNMLDRAYSRTGSLILVHGGCTSTGCYAMTNPVMEEIYGLADLALRNGQERFQVHVFPFRMTQDNLDAHAVSEWHDFWRNLKDGYDVFERTRVPPKVSVCNRKYVVTEASLAESGSPAATADDPLGCESNEVDVATLEREENEVRPHRTRKAASKARSRHSAGRNVRKRYAAARRARMAAKRIRTSHMSSQKREH